MLDLRRGRSIVWAAGALLVVLPGPLAGCDHTAAPPPPAPATQPAAPAPAPAPAPAAAPAPGEAPGAAAEPAAPLPGEEDPGVARFLGFSAPKPVTWIWRPPTNRMRAANYTVPGTGGADQAEIVVFRGIGGGKQANIDRWAGQFRTAGQEPASPKITELEAGGVAVTMVELAGAYMAMGTGHFTADRLFLGAVIEAPEGEIYVRLVGPTATVAPAREAFLAMLRGLRRTGPPPP